MENTKMKLMNILKVYLEMIMEHKKHIHIVDYIILEKIKMYKHIEKFLDLIILMRFSMKQNLQKWLEQGLKLKQYIKITHITE